MNENNLDQLSATHDSIAVANYFIELNNKNTKRGLTLMQLLKLSYIAHGFKLALFGYPLANEAVQAWKYGPVFAKIYDEFKRSPYEIKEFALDLDETTETLVPASSKFDEIEKRIIKLIYDIYGALDGWRLSALTHEKGTPWYEVRENDKKNRIYGTTIPNERIEEYFKREIINKHTSG